MTTGMRIFMGLFFSVFLAVGVGATYTFAVKPWTKVWAARDWTPVSCRIVSSEVEHHEGSDSTTYSVAIVYTYRVGGREFTGKRYDFTPGSSSSRKSKKEIATRYRPGATATCYVNPQNPADAVIEREKVSEWGFGLIPLVFVLAGSCGVYFAIFGQRKPRPEDSSVTRGFRTSRAFARPRTVVQEYFPDEAEGATGPVELKPTQSRVGMLVGMLFFAVFWNGIVSVFVVNAVGDAGRGVVQWVLMIFLLPFIAIGLFLIGLVVRIAMTMANPVPRITVNKRTFAPGETLELSWRFDGQASRLKDTRLWLEGREEATYRRGTDTRTDKEVFSTMEIATTTGLSAGQPGMAKLKLPERMMHSFRSDNNRVVWVLQMKGGIAWWPDLSEEFALAIRPAARAAAQVEHTESTEIT